MCSLDPMPSPSLAAPAGASSRPRLACPGIYRGRPSCGPCRVLMCGLDPMPSPSLAAPASTSSRPRLACPGRRRGCPSCGQW